MSGRYVPDTGHIIKVDLNPSSGHEQAGWRPALVISEAAYNGAANLAIICPITNQVKGYPFEVPIPAGEAVAGVVLADQIKAADLTARRAKLLGQAPRVVLETTRQYISIILGL